MKSAISTVLVLLIAARFVARVEAAELPPNEAVKAVKLFEVPAYCEGVVFDHAGNGYVSWDKTITRFTLDGKHQAWAETGAPNGHKILADGTHLVCDASQHAVLRLSADGKMLDSASKECDGKPLRGPNDLTLDAPNGGFYFTDPGGSNRDTRIGTVHYVDRNGKTHLVAENFAFPNGIALTADGKTLYLAESQTNQIHIYDVLGPGKVKGPKQSIDLPKHESGDYLRSQPDGICLDADGNLYVAHYGMKQVQVLDKSGKVIRRYPGGNLTTSNVAFGGPSRDQLFVTGGLVGEGGSAGGVFRLDLGVKGLKILPDKK
jgi:gluconolactonase